MGKIVAIGGGEIGRPGTKVETTGIDKEILRLTGKKKPKLLFIPTASHDSEDYFNTVKKHFGKKLNCNVDVLYLIKEKHTKSEIERKVYNSDIIYVGGGNTLDMMKIWRKQGIDDILFNAYKKGIVLSGVSAGSVCWFRYAQSDSWASKNPKLDLIKVKCLNLIDALHVPHFNGKEYNRKKNIKKMMKNTPGVAICIDNCCAIEIIDNNYRIITSKPSANAYKAYWKKGKYHLDLIEKKKEFSPLEELLKK